MSTSTRRSLLACALTAALLLGGLPALMAVPQASLVPVAGPLVDVPTAAAAPLNPPCSRTAAITATTAPGLTLPSAAAPNSASIVVSGTGYDQFEPVVVYFDAAVPFGGTDQGSSATSTTADVNGAISVTIPLNARPAANSQYPIAAVGVGGSCATFGGVAIGNVPSVEGTTATLSPDAVTISSNAQTVLISSSIVPSNVVALAATIDTASSNNYSTASQASPLAVGAFPRPELSGSTFAVFQLTVPGFLTPNVHSIVLTGTVSGNATPFRDATGLRYLMTTPAQISAGPVSGPPLSVVTVNGSGFAASSASTAAPITVTFTGPGAGAPSFTATTTSSMSGIFSTPISVPVGAVPGTAGLRAIDASGTQATGAFVVTPLTSTNSTASLVVVPAGGSACPVPAGAAASAAPTQTVVLVLGGFAPAETINVVVNGAGFATLKADAAGNASGGVPFPVANRDATVANGLPGDRGVAQNAYTVSAVGASSGKVATQIVASCGTALTAASSTPTAGAALAISGTGFAANEVVTVSSYLNSQAVSLTSISSPGVAFALTATTNALGQFSGTVTTPLTFTTYTVRAQGATSTLVAATAITPAPPGLTLPSSLVYPCSTFGIGAAGGFAPNDTITVVPQGGAAVTATASASGAFQATASIPANAAPGNVPVTVTSSRGSFTAAVPVTVPVASLSITPTTVAQGGSTTVSGTGYIPSSPISLSTEFLADGTAVPAGGGTQMITASATGTFLAPLTISPTVAVIGGAYQVRGTSACSTQDTAVAPVSVSGAPGPGPTPAAQPTTVYFAEGYTGRAATNGRADFDEYISVLNPDNAATTVTFTYQIQGQAAPVVKAVTVGATSDLLESVNGDVGADKIVSTIVSSNNRIAVERVIDRTTPGGRLDSDSSLGNTAPGTAWYFAEGYTGATFQEYLTVQNPGAATATVTVTFLPQSAPAAIPRTVTFAVPATGRSTENIRRDYLRYGQQSVGMIVTSDQPIVAERVLYFGDGAGSAKYGATAAAGLSGAATRFFFAYGSNPGATPANVGPGQQPNDESYVTIINPATVVGGVPSSDASVLVSFFDAMGRPLGSKSIAVSPQTRETVRVNDAIAPLGGPYSTQVTSDEPILVEKPQYFGGSPNIGRHPGVSPAGVPIGERSVLFPNVSTLSPTGTPLTQTVFLLNTDLVPITVQGTYYTPAGQTVTIPYPVGAGQIAVVNVNADTHGLAAGPLGAQFATASGQFVATRIASTADGLAYIGNQGVQGP